jgi:hypothetical protein
MPPRREVVDPPLAERPKRGRLRSLPHHTGACALSALPTPMAGESPAAKPCRGTSPFRVNPGAALAELRRNRHLPHPAAYTRRKFHPSQDRNPTIQGNIPPQNRARRTRRGIGALRNSKTINLSSGTGNASEGLHEGYTAIPLKYSQQERRWSDIGMGMGSVFRKISGWGLMSPPAPSHWAFSPVLPERGRFAIIGASFGAVCVFVV